MSPTRASGSPEKRPPPAEAKPAGPINEPLADFVVHLFARCVDPEDFFWAVLEPTFPLPEHRNLVIKRLGWLNVLDCRNLCGYQSFQASSIRVELTRFRLCFLDPRRGETEKSRLVQE